MRCMHPDAVCGDVEVQHGFLAAVRMFEVGAPVKTVTTPPENRIDAVKDYEQRVCDGTLRWSTYFAARCAAARCPSVVYTKGTPIRCWVKKDEWLSILIELGLWASSTEQTYECPMRSLFWGGIADALECDRKLRSKCEARREYLLRQMKSG